MTAMTLSLALLLATTQPASDGSASPAAAVGDYWTMPVQTTGSLCGVFSAYAALRDLGVEVDVEAVR